MIKIGQLRLAIKQILKYRYNLRHLVNMGLSLPTVFSELLHPKKLPYYLHIEPTDNCNLKCVMCNTNTTRANEKKENLTIDKFNYILSQFPDIKFICLVGNGEPLLNKDLFKMIRAAKNKKITIGTISNGILLDKDLAHKLLDSGIDWLSFSLDGANKKTYEGIRNGASFEKVLENIKYLNSIKKKRAVDIAIIFVAMRENIRQLPDIIGLADRLGVKKVVVLKAHFLENAAGYGKVKHMAEVSNEEAARVKRDAFKIADRLGIYLVFSSFYDLKNTKRRCHAPWISTYITSRGYICPCCALNDYNKMNFGNIFKEDFSTIWNNKLYRDFRIELKGKTMPPVCRGCAFYTKSYIPSLDINVVDQLRNILLRS